MAGAMLGFSLARLQYLDVAGIFAKDAAPGEWYWYRQGIRRVGITIHLASILPAGCLMVWQFIPTIRHHAILFHRVNGYIIIVLVFLGNIGALMIARHAFGGYLSTQSAVGMLVIMTTMGITLAYYNIKRLQIDQHRAWMLRSMIYLGTIITTRFIMVISAVIISQIGSYYSPMTCGEVAYIVGQGNYLNTTYPQCTHLNLNSTAADHIIVAVHADFTASTPDQIGASMRLSFGMALWLSIFLHTVGVEIYLALTPRESQRLREVSYQRQLEKGLKYPGSAGLTVQKFGDANEWQRLD